MGLERLSSVTMVSRFLDAPEDTVVQLLEEGRLGGVLVDALRRKGVTVTPAVKNTVETVVRTVGPKDSDPASNLDRAYLMDPETTATIMFTDIVGSTAIMERLGDRRAREMLRRHNDVIRRHTKAHGGVEVKFMGDGFMLSFRSARRGVACAASVQGELSASFSQHPEAPVAVRMGLSVGEPIREEQDLFGKAVTLASRISDKAIGGQVLISNIVHALVVSTGEFAFREVGDFELKGLSGRHPLYELLL